MSEEFDISNHECRYYNKEVSSSWGVIDYLSGFTEYVNKCDHPEKMDKICSKLGCPILESER